MEQDRPEETVENIQEAWQRGDHDETPIVEEGVRRQPEQGFPSQAGPSEDDPSKRTGEMASPDEIPMADEVPDVEKLDR
jgi:hypothetical protein